MGQVISMEDKAQEIIEQISNARMPELYRIQTELYGKQIDIIESIIDVLNDLYVKDTPHMVTKPLADQINYLSAISNSINSFNF